MCCLFGFVDYGHKLTRKERLRLLSTLSTACEERGTDATGIAYNFGGKLHIFKRPVPAHLMWYRVPGEAAAVMGHTRMTTQGSEKRNQNNHPFPGFTGDNRFALAHNGVLFNDKALRKQYKLPVTSVETDSYIAVQLLEQYGKVDFDSLRFMAEELEGSFTITVLTDRDELYFVKGNHPLVKIQTDAQLDKTLLIFKDSYANCFVPFLVEDYTEILLVDPRYYADDLELLLESEYVTDVLYLYNADTLASDSDLKTVIRS